MYCELLCAFLCCSLYPDSGTALLPVEPVVCAHISGTQLMIKVNFSQPLPCSTHPQRLLTSIKIPGISCDIVLYVSSEKNAIVAFTA